MFQSVAIESLENRRMYSVTDPSQIGVAIITAGGSPVVQVSNPQPKNPTPAGYIWDGYKTIQLADGKSIRYGTVTVDQMQGKIAVARFLADGSLDTSFGDGGFTVLAFNDISCWAQEAVVTSDGKILLAGSVMTNDGSDIALARLNADGSLDSTFGFGGKVTASYLSGAYTMEDTKAVVIRSDGSIVVGGFAFDRDNSISKFELVSFSADGRICKSFGKNGVVLQDTGGLSTITDIVVQSPEHIVVAGFTVSADKVAMLRFNPDGSLDTTFGQNGAVVEYVGPILNEPAYDIDIKTDGSLVLSGGSDIKYSGHFTADGQKINDPAPDVDPPTQSPTQPSTQTPTQKLPNVPSILYYDSTPLIAEVSPKNPTPALAPAPALPSTAFSVIRISSQIGGDADHDKSTDFLSFLTD